MTLLSCGTKLNSLMGGGNAHAKKDYINHNVHNFIQSFVGNLVAGHISRNSLCLFVLHFDTWQLKKNIYINYQYD